MSDESSPPDYDEFVATLKLDERTLKRSGGETIRPAQETVRFDPMRTLPELRVDSDPADLSLKGMLGEGGMGVVHLANQSALERDVAVKTLRDDASGSAVRGLLQEAFVTGHLEHPNIIPVYTLGKDTRGAPLFVMKRIEGVSWLAVITEPKSAPAGQQPDIGWHIRILMDVCDAVRFAHSRGIVHRDIKPENVMIGEFGEVYLLDWGLAIVVDDDELTGRFPHRRNVRGIAGTPAYMAPEMTKDIPDDVDRTTDVYLLGACLHHVITGHGRHQGQSLMDIMFSAFDSKPYDYPPHVSAELASIANRATAARKQDRYSSVEEFKEALAAHLEHRASIQLAQDAKIGLLRLRRTPDDDPEADLQFMFMETRMGFQQALKLWPKNEEALQGLAECLRGLVRFHVGRGELASAKQALAPLPDLPGYDESLVREVAVLEAKIQADEEEFAALRSLAKDVDWRRGATTRAVVLLLMGGIWTYSSVYGYILQSDPYGRLPESSLFLGLLRNAGVPAIILLFVAKRFLRNKAGRQLITLLVGTLVFMVGNRITGHALELNRVAASAMEWSLYAMGLVGAGAAFDRRFAYLGAMFMLIVMLAPVYPYQRMLFMAIAQVIMTCTFLWILVIEPRREALENSA